MSAVLMGIGTRIGIGPMRYGGSGFPRPGLIPKGGRVSACLRHTEGFLPINLRTHSRPSPNTSRPHIRASTGAESREYTGYGECEEAEEEEGAGRLGFVAPLGLVHRAVGDVVPSEIGLNCGKIQLTTTPVSFAFKHTLLLQLCTLSFVAVATAPQNQKSVFRRSRTSGKSG